MTTSVRLTQIGLCMLSGAGLYFVLIVTHYNGTSEMLRKVLSRKPTQLPATIAPLRTVYTGINFIDSQFQMLVILFWNITSGDLPAASIQCFHFAGQYLAVLTILLIEAVRHGNKRKLVSYVSCWVGLGQLVSYAVTIPVFLAIYLGTSPTIFPSTADITPDSVGLASVSLSVTLGYVLPTLLLSLPVPSMASFDQKQLYNAIWQVFPLWVSITHSVLKVCLPKLFPTLRRPSQAVTVAILRLTYLYAFVIASITHAACLTLAIAFDVLPNLFNPAMNGDMSFGFSRVFLPSHGRVPSIAEGTFVLLKNDEIIGSSALILWASLMFVSSWTLGGAPSRYLWLLPTVAVLTILVGPSGCALALIWARDEVVLAQNFIGHKKAM